jgi:hypothetical protein
MTKQKRSSIQWVSAVVPALSAFPAAYFVARSTWAHLVLGWPGIGDTPLWLGAATAVVAGLVVEGLGTVSVFLAATFWRWNRWKATRPDEGGRRRVLKAGYDLAPFWLAAANVGVYLAATAVLLLLLEAVPEAAGYAPFLFPWLTLVGGLCWSLLDQHRDRLALHGLEWNWTVARQAEEEQKPPKPEPQVPEPVFASKRAHIEHILRTEPSLSEAEIVRRTGYSPSYVNEVASGNGRK